MDWSGLTLAFSVGIEQWFHNSSTLLLTTPSEARDQLYTLHIKSPHHRHQSGPLPLPLPHSSSSPQILSSDVISYTSSSLASPPETHIYNLTSNSTSAVTAFATASGILKDKDVTLPDGEEYWFDGAEGVRIQGWIVKPPGFKKGKKGKWPMAFLIHGGPQGAWEDSWSWRYV